MDLAGQVILKPCSDMRTWFAVQARHDLVDTILHHERQSQST